jgi:hypothetical protein
MRERTEEGMATSKQTYECYVCKRNGFPDTKVYLEGKTEDGKTIYKNEDMSSHNHKQRAYSGQNNARESSSFRVSDESVQRGITAFTMMSNLSILLELTQKHLVTMDEKLDRLLNLAELRK